MGHGTRWRLSRLLALSAALNIVVAAAAAAQTVIVTKAPPGGKIEVVFAGKPAGSAAADSSGNATIPIDPNAAGAAREIDARVYVDVCSQLHRILVVERNQLPSTKDEGCDRREIPGIFWVRPVNTLVVNVGGPIPTLLLVKGKYNPNNPSPVRRAPAGLVLFGGGGLIAFDEIAAAACGTLSDCRQDGSGAIFSGGAAYWIRPWLAAEGSYIRPSKLTTAGAGGDFDFTTTFDVHVFTVVANVGVPVGPVRIYGKVGFNFHEATTTTRQVSGADTQTIVLDTEGWGPVYGGGFEGWIKPRFALYVEGAFGTLKGQPHERTIEGEMNEGFQYFVVGARVKLF
jgi:hypothetical protein